MVPQFYIILYFTLPVEQTIVQQRLLFKSIRNPAKFRHPALSGIWVKFAGIYRIAL